MHIYAAGEGKRCETTSRRRTHESRLAMQEESEGAGRQNVGEVLQAACRKEMQHPLLLQRICKERKDDPRLKIQRSTLYFF
jgi:hypothetical protein